MKAEKHLILLLIIFLFLIACSTNNVVNNSVPGSPVSVSPGTSSGASVTPSAGSSTGTPASTSTGTTVNTSPGSPVSPSTGASVIPSPLPVITGAITEVEPNDEFATAMKVSPNPGVSLNSTIGDTDRADFYEVNIPTGSQDGILKVTLNETNNQWSPVLIFYNSDQTALNNSTSDNITNPFTWENYVSAGKKYYLKIEGETEIKTNYVLTFQFTPVPDQFEPNNSFTDAKTLLPGKTVDIYLFSGVNSPEANSNNDIDYFKLNVPEGTKTIRVNIENKSTSQAPQNFAVELFDPDQTSFGNITGDYDLANYLTDFQIEKAGDYYIKITASNSPLASKLTVTFQ